MTTGTLMSSSDLRWPPHALWVATTLLAFTLLNAHPGPGWLYLAAVSVIPPSLLRELWDGRHLTMSAIARSSGARR